MSSSPRACIPPVPSTTRSDVGVGGELHARVGRLSPTTSAASQAVTWMTRSCPAFAAAPARSVCTESVALSGPSRCVPDWIDTRRAYRADARPKETNRWPLNWITRSRRRSRSTRASPRSPTSSASCRASRAAACSRRRDRTRSRPRSLMKMGAMSMKFTGTVEVAEKDAAAHRAVLRVKSREAGRPGTRQRGRHLPARGRRRDDPHQGADHRQGGVDGRGRRHRRARRADHRLHRKARRALIR